MVGYLFLVFSEEYPGDNLLNKNMDNSVIYAINRNVYLFISNLIQNNVLIFVVIIINVNCCDLRQYFNFGRSGKKCHNNLN